MKNIILEFIFLNTYLEDNDDISVATVTKNKINKYTKDEPRFFIRVLV
jgi:hypothetical protein